MSLISNELRYNWQLAAFACFHCLVIFSKVESIASCVYKRCVGGRRSGGGEVIGD